MHLSCRGNYCSTDTKSDGVCQMNNVHEDTQTEDRPLRMSALVAEFGAVRDEVLFRANAQATLMQINITAAATVAGFVLADKADPLALIVVAIISPVLGMLWLDHHAAIIQLGNYATDEIKKSYNRVSDFPYPDYQNYVERLSGSGSPNKLSGRVNFATSVMITFGFLPFVALAYVACNVKDNHAAAFLAPAGLAMFLLAMFFSQFRRGFEPRLNPKTAPST